MELQQLKLLAGRIRGLLEQSNHTVSHNQSLDLISALPGLRNWPEVQAFPDRVAACELDATSAGRMAFRIKKKFELVFTPQSMLAELSPPGTKKISACPRYGPVDLLQACTSRHPKTRSTRFLRYTKMRQMELSSTLSVPVTTGLEVLIWAKAVCGPTVWNGCPAEHCLS